MAPKHEADRQDIISVEEEIRSTKNEPDYIAVDLLWVALVKLANRMPVTDQSYLKRLIVSSNTWRSYRAEYRRILALIDTFEVETVRSILSLRSVDELLELSPPLEAVLADPHERLEKEKATRSIKTIRECRHTDPHAALFAMGDILKRIRNKRAHGFKTRSGRRDREILGAARPILDALCQVALDATRKHVSRNC